MGAPASEAKGKDGLKSHPKRFAGAANAAKRPREGPEAPPEPREVAPEPEPRAAAEPEGHSQPGGTSAWTPRQGQLLNRLSWMPQPF